MSEAFEGAAPVNDTTVDGLKRGARTASLSWVAALPVLAVGMTCFWAQRDAAGMAGNALKIGALLVPLAFVIPAFVCDAVRGVRAGLVTVAFAIGRGLLFGVLGLVLGSLMLFVDVLRPEAAFGFFADAFSTGHLIAAGLPTLVAVAAYLWAVWGDANARRPVTLVVFGVAALLGPVAWWWSASVAFEAMRYANADNSLLLAHAIALAGLAISCVGSAIVCALRKG